MDDPKKILEKTKQYKTLMDFDLNKIGHTSGPVFIYMKRKLHQSSIFQKTAIFVRIKNM